MPQPKGKSGNYNGKPKGTLNRSTKELRTMLTAAFEGEIENIPNTLKKLEPEKRLEILSKFIGFILPKPIEVQESTTESIQPPNVTFVSVDMSLPKV
ncbi:MAG: hypothetical protein IPM69_01175 [Ignavibacteria bacterium]|nr:hypothetical protein [Ignavibacteria bacterium]